MTRGAGMAGWGVAPNVVRFVVALATVLLLGVVPAHAHKASDSYLRLSIDGGTLSGQWDIALRDLEFALGLDANGDGEITWGELRARHASIAAYALSRLTVRAAGESCPLRVIEHQVDDHSDGAYAVLRLSGDCAGGRAADAIEYRLLFDVDREHRGLLNLERSGAVSTVVFSPERPVLDLAPGSSAPVSALDAFVQYAIEGVWHIWIGIDHVLFLVSLLLPAVLVRTAGHWQPVAALRPALREVVWTVTAFTLAHSITLALAALEVVSLPSRLVESVIALSVVLAAANNLAGWVTHARWVVAFVFGLIHGFGFASVLADLGLPREQLLVALVGFNVGVELGQLAIVAAFLPIAWRLRRSGFYRKVVFVGGSIVIVLLASVWFVGRAFDISLL